MLSEKQLGDILMDTQSDTVRLIHYDFYEYIRLCNNLSSVANGASSGELNPPEIKKHEALKTSVC